MNRKEGGEEERAPVFRALVVACGLLWVGKVGAEYVLLRESEFERSEVVEEEERTSDELASGRRWLEKQAVRTIEAVAEGMGLDLSNAEAEKLIESALIPQEPGPGASKRELRDYKMLQDMRDVVR